MGTITPEPGSTPGKRPALARMSASSEEMKTQNSFSMKMSADRIHDRSQKPLAQIGSLIRTSCVSKVRPSHREVLWPAAERRGEFAPRRRSALVRSTLRPEFGALIGAATGLQRLVV